MPVQQMVILLDDGVRQQDKMDIFVCNQANQHEMRKATGCD